MDQVASSTHLFFGLFADGLGLELVVRKLVRLRIKLGAGHSGQRQVGGRHLELDLDLERDAVLACRSQSTYNHTQVTRSRDGSINNGRLTFTYGTQRPSLLARLGG